MKTSTKIEDDLFDRIDGDKQRLREAVLSFVSSKQNLKVQHVSEIESFEETMFRFLWRCRPYLTATEIAKMLKLSRQALYNKWSKYGYNADDQE